MRRAIVSVSDKTGIVEFAKCLVELGWEVVSTGGTARVLRDAGLPVKEVSEVTGFPEILSGRVKTLHPLVHGGILARRDHPDDMAQISSLGIAAVDMVVCNLYPFIEKATGRPASIDEIFEEIDIGGPTLLRASAKNWRWVIPVCNPLRYQEIATQLRTYGDVDIETRKQLAAEVFRHTALYDSAIASYLGTVWGRWPLDFPEELSLGYRRAMVLRYGENPHQKAAYYEPVIGRRIRSLTECQLQGKELSYNNINDADTAFRAVCDLPSPACVIVKHASPCGAALGNSAAEAFKRAYDADPVSAFGGVVALNCPVDSDCAEIVRGVFLEVLVAPSFTEEAMKILRSRKDLRVLSLGSGAPSEASGYSVRTVLGGLLVQEYDSVLPDHEEWKVVSKRQPTENELRDLRFAMTVCKYVRSNAIVLARDGATVGIGGGQPNRVDCVRLARQRAGQRAIGSVMASDAFFPFPDSVEEAALAGVTAIAHPGGSIRDQESIDAADAHGMAMIITGKRHFLH